jgi:hypothetical protein
MAEELTLENLKTMAERRGLRLAEDELQRLRLTDDELQRLLPGVIRARKQAAELREIVVREDEPAGAFDATSHRRK